MAWTLSGNIKGPTATMVTANVQTGTSYTNVVGDAGKEIQMSSSSANVVTMDASIMSAGHIILVRQTGTGQTSVAAASGTTFINGGPTLKTAQKGSCLYVRFDSTSLAYIGGEEAAS